MKRAWVTVQQWRGGLAVTGLQDAVVEGDAWIKRQVEALAPFAEVPVTGRARAALTGRRRLCLTLGISGGQLCGVCSAEAFADAGARFDFDLAADGLFERLAHVETDSCWLQAALDDAPQLHLEVGDQRLGQGQFRAANGIIRFRAGDCPVQLVFRLQSATTGNHMTVDAQSTIQSTMHRMSRALQPSTLENIPPAATTPPASAKSAPLSGFAGLVYPCSAPSASPPWLNPSCLVSSPEQPVAVHPRRTSLNLTLIDTAREESRKVSELQAYVHELSDDLADFLELDPCTRQQASLTSLLFMMKSEIVRLNSILQRYREALSGIETTDAATHPHTRRRNCDTPPASSDARHRRDALSRCPTRYLARHTSPSAAPDPGERHAARRRDARVYRRFSPGSATESLTRVSQVGRESSLTCRRRSELKQELEAQLAGVKRQIAQMRARA
ncbi:hypothetical protein CDCA_CDCA03G1013 [Cyanidium caldarium]|uniref:Uncharacterized protein n=1 Tax=Cyanidium caldarium TaxID=2771 RepID=A0AAV9IRV8_CYACA|nr:hypothetical protein CDCA_CDCA03G1013 [Cyanidium caldarium]